MANIFATVANVHVQQTWRSVGTHHGPELQVNEMLSSCSPLPDLVSRSSDFGFLLFLLLFFCSEHSNMLIAVSGKILLYHTCYQRSSGINTFSN